MADNDPQKILAAARQGLKDQLKQTSYAEEMRAIPLIEGQAAKLKSVVKLVKKGNLAEARELDAGLTKTVTGIIEKHAPAEFEAVKRARRENLQVLASQGKTGNTTNPQNTPAGEDTAKNTPPAAEAAKPKEIKAGTLKEVKDGKFVFADDHFHPEMEEAQKALSAATDEAAKTTAQAKITKINHAVDAANLKAAKAMTAEQIKAAGHSEEAFKQGLKELESTVKSRGAFGILRQGKEFGGGIGAALKHNFGEEARAASKGKIALKGAGVLVGLGMVGHAVLKSEKDGPEGEPQPRSWVVRIGEGAAGVGIITASALSGHRVR